MSEATKAAFRIKEYKVDQYSFQAPSDPSVEIEYDIEPSGKFISSDNEFELTLKLIARLDNEEADTVLSATFVSIFAFQNVNSFDDVPSYFFRNAMAILFPFMRAFASTMTLQANQQIFLLPLFNFVGLEEELKSSTKII